MKRIEIHQSIMAQPWPLVVAVAFFLLPIAIYLSSGNTDLSWNAEFIGIIFTSIFSFITLFWAMSLKNHVIIESDKVQYKPSPFGSSLNTIQLDELESWAIKDYKFGFSRGLGYKRDLRGNKYYVMRFGKVLELSLKKGGKIVLGLDKPELTQRFVQTNWQTND
jgi:hypothetical protein